VIHLLSVGIQEGYRSITSKNIEAQPAQPASGRLPGGDTPDGLGDPKVLKKRRPNAVYEMFSRRNRYLTRELPNKRE
jgi:hypothetical protein